MTMKHKRSNTAGKVPLVADLEDGQLCVNTNDAILFMRKTVLGTPSIVRVGAEMSAPVAATLREASLPAFRAAIGAHDPVTTPIAFGSLSAGISLPDWACAVDVQFYNLQINSTGHALVQLGTAASWDTDGYTGGASILTNAAAVSCLEVTNGMIAAIGAASGRGLCGVMSIRRESASSPSWVYSLAARLSSTIETFGGGFVTLADVATRIRCFPSSGSFSGGSASIRYSK
jgi:hypothetical protein